MPSNHLILCHTVLLLPSIFPSIRVFSNKSVLCIRWPKYWSFSFSISPCNEYSVLISFRIDWFDLLAVQGTLKSLIQHHGANKGPSSQSYGFSSSQVWMWELDYKESWAPKNWCFWTVVLEKTIESPLDYREIQPVHPKRNQYLIFIGRPDCWSWNSNSLAAWCKELTHWKRPWCWERFKVGGKWTTEDEMVGWHHHASQIQSSLRNIDQVLYMCTRPVTYRTQ